MQQLKRSHAIKAVAQGVILASSRIIVFFIILIVVLLHGNFLGADIVFSAVALLDVLQNTLLKRMYVCTQSIAEGLASITRIQVLSTPLAVTLLSYLLKSLSCSSILTHY